MPSRPCRESYTQQEKLRPESNWRDNGEELTNQHPSFDKPKLRFCLCVLKSPIQLLQLRGQVLLRGSSTAPLPAVGEGSSQQPKSLLQGTKPRRLWEILLSCQRMARGLQPTPQHGSPRLQAPSRAGSGPGDLPGEEGTLPALPLVTSWRSTPGRC